MLMNNPINKKCRNNLIQYAVDFMPKNLDDQRILQERAEHVSKEKVKKMVAENLVTYVRFKLGDHEYYGIPYHVTKEVMHKGTLTRIPSVPDFIAGVINRRGMILTIIDLKKFFHLPVSDQTKNEYIITVICNAMTVGILVDNIVGSDAYDPTLIDTPLSSAGTIKADYVLGLHNGITTIINVKTVLSELALQLGGK
ncbi:MAG: purine-binding chemotaxis protein CheW [Gammaproteobacteria bacterium]|nr:MAG: purine-binding chemotaxis protein CheW [Gammaproteobacteria bacterium]